jgi:hypothetical protein
VRDQLAALWNADAPAKPEDLDASVGHDDGALVGHDLDAPVAPDHGDAWEPPEDRLTPPPCPPSGTWIIARDQAGRTVPRAVGSVVKWTWIGADGWYHVGEYPLPALDERGQVR